MRKTTFLFAAIVTATMSAFAGEPVKYRGIFINDEDYGLRAWAKKNYGKEGIGVRALTQVFDLMKADGLNLLWPAMHGGGYEFSTRPENFELAKQYGIAIGTSHCEPMLRNNCYLKGDDKDKWSWLKHRDFLEDYWREGARRGLASGGDILWTIGMRGIHDHGLPDGETMQEKVAVMEDVFKFQTSLLPPAASKLFIPYKEVLPVFNAGLKVPKGTTIMWTNDNFGYIRRLGGPQCEGYGGGIYWHLSYHGYPHGCEHINPLPPAFMWYELVAKCWNNGVRDVWMVNAGDVFEAELLLYCYGKFAQDPDWWASRHDPQSEVLGMWVKDELEVG
ncbi:MAG: glycosyl hydrolase 115 family protein, partial [Kiritimatiellae bacterium]|nr:glycosyl hydrolase 115 family protein [Kiritimatiellia bacterium]